eukprot:6086142-Prymnesium_polylepis.1
MERVRGADGDDRVGVASEKPQVAPVAAMPRRLIRRHIAAHEELRLGQPVAPARVELPPVLPLVDARVERGVHD